MSATTSPLLAALGADAASERRAATRRYAQLLAAFVPPPGGDAPAPAEPPPPDPKRLERLKQLAAALGKSPADVAADADAIQSLRHHRAMIARARGSTAARAPAERAFTDFDAETARILEARRREYFRLYAVYEQLGIARRAASDAVRDVNRLLEKHAELLAHEPRASEREIE